MKKKKFTIERMPAHLLGNDQYRDPPYEVWHDGDIVGRHSSEEKARAHVKAMKEHEQKHWKEK